MFAASPEAVIKLRSKIEVARQRLAAEVSKDEELTIVRDLNLRGIRTTTSSGEWWVRLVLVQEMDIIEVISQQSLATDHRVFCSDPNWRNYEFELEAKKTWRVEAF